MQRSRLAIIRTTLVIATIAGASALTSCRTTNSARSARRALDPSPQVVDGPVQVERNPVNRVRAAFGTFQM